MEITKIKVWFNWNRTEQRVYITYIDGGKRRSGCFYRDGNAYQKKGTLENLTEEILAAAAKICFEHKGEVGYCTMYESAIEKYDSNYNEIKKTKSYDDDDSNNRIRISLAMKRDIARGYPVNLDDYDD